MFNRMSLINAAFVYGALLIEIWALYWTKQFYEVHELILVFYFVLFFCKDG